MARKRMIDPSMWTHERFMELSVNARLLFIGMISHADDEGRGRAAAVSLKAQVFPGDPIEPGEILTLLEEVRRARFAVIYGGGKYYSLPGWKDHQTVNRPYPSKLPEPSQEESNSMNTHGTFNEHSMSVHSQGKGKEGKGSKDPHTSYEGGKPPGSLAEILGSFREQFRERNGKDPAKAGMEALGKAVKGWLAGGSHAGEILEALGWFFAEGRKDFDPLHFVKAYSNGYAGRIKEAREQSQAEERDRHERHRETLSRAIEEAKRFRPGEDKAEFYRAKAGLLGSPPYSPDLLPDLQALARLCEVESPC